MRPAARRVALVSALVVLAACGSDPKRPAASSSTSGPEPSATAAPELTTAPLTGAPTPDQGVTARPAMTVKVENTKAARPQSGVESADVVYEEVVEGGITRLAVVFHSQVPSVVGPIRSVRRTDAGIVTPLRGVFVYSGGAKYAVDSISQAPVVRLDETRAGAAMFRDRSRRAPHNLFGRGSDLLAKASGAAGPPAALFEYGAPAGAPATRATVGFRGEFTVTWDYDAAAKRWVRTIFGRPDMAASGVRLGATNVVIQAVRYQGGAGVIGAEAQLVGSGKVWVLSQGTVTTGTWQRSDANDPGRLLDANGAPIVLAPGPTWVELPDTTYGVTVTGPAPSPGTGG